MLIIVAAMAFGAMRLDLAQSYRLKRDKEAELLFRGLAYKLAIKAYYSKNSRYPRQLKELADDQGFFEAPLYATTLQRPYDGRRFQARSRDRRAQLWELLARARMRRLRRLTSTRIFEDFQNAKTYADWKFETKPGNDTGTPRIAPGASSPPPGMGSGAPLSDVPARMGR